MNPASRQDIQNIVDAAQNRSYQRVALKQDVVNVNDNLKNLLVVIQQNQQIMRQAEYQRLQQTRRVVALEARLIQLEQEIRNYRSILERVASVQAQQPKHIFVPAQTPTQQSEAQPQYVYRPA